MTWDRALALLGVVIGLPAFLAVFFSPHVGLAVGAVIVAVAFLAASVLVAWVIDRPPWEYESARIELDLTGGPAMAILSKSYTIRSNANGQVFLRHGNIGADGPVHSFTWDGEPVPANHVQQSMGQYEVTVEFRPPRVRGEVFSGVLRYQLDHSFPAALEALEYDVDLPTQIAELTVKLPAAKPCNNPKATVAVGGQEKPLPGLSLSTDRKTLSLKVKRPKLGSTVRIYWNW